MIRLTSTKTLPILFYMLEHPLFSQSEIRDETEISIGRINKIVTFLKDKQVVIKDGTKYRLVSPNRLVEMIADQYRMEEYLSYDVAISKKDLLKTMKDKGTLCLYSALEKHDNALEVDEVYLYDDEGVQEFLNHLDRGSTRVHIYKRPQTDETSLTSAVQTVMDLASLNQQTITKNLRLKLWNTLQ
ncbi:hypothetical protein H6504_01800 [Candidatus Woesearchaeota archaeon]|nr:hypothetical protein [Candidatus Woesearchaeota archaeon]